jgi:hypothetical protein
MSMIHQCDRCGEVYDIQRTAERIHVESSDGTRDGTYELCFACKLRLQDFLGNKMVPVRVPNRVVISGTGGSN